MSERAEDAEATPATAETQEGTGEAPSAAPPPAEPATRRGLVSALVVVAVIALGWPLIIARLDVLRPPPPPTPMALFGERLDALEGRLKAAENAQRSAASRLTAAEETLGGLEPAEPVDLAPLREALADLDARVSELASRIESTGTSAGLSPTDADRLGAIEPLRSQAGQNAAQLKTLGAEAEAVKGSVEALEGRLDAIEARLGREAEAPRTAALIVALGRLKEAALGAAPFARALAAFAALAGGEEPLAAPLAALREHGAAGVPDATTLARRFPALAREALRADEESRAEDWIGRTLARLGALVRVRRVGEVEGERVDARLARAERRLVEGRLAEAVSEVAALEGAAADALVDWLADARARLRVEEAIAVLEEAVVARLGAAGSAGQ